MDVLIIMGSDSDWETMKPCVAELEKFGVKHNVRVSSAHRSPDRTVRIVKKATKDGVKVFICAAGLAAHLGGVVAAHTPCPVIGVPMPAGPLKGNDALLSTVQMPPGVPVATVGIGAAKNAAWLAVQILAISDAKLREKLIKSKKAFVAGVDKADRGLRSKK